MTKLPPLERAVVLRNTPRNRRSPWAVRGAIPRSVMLTLAVSGFLLPFIGWLILSASAWVDPVFLPTPMKVLQRMTDWLINDDLMSDVGISIGRVFGGFIAATVLALPVGIMIGTYAPAKALLEPLTDFSRYLPAVAFIPLILLWVGIDESAKVTVIFIGTFFQMVLMIAADIVRVPNTAVEAAKTMGATDGEVLQYVLIPAARPAMLDTMRCNMGLAWTYLVVAELVAANSGLGFSILKAQRFLQTDKIFAGILLIGLVGLLTDLAFRWLHRHCFRWHHLRG
ncbi:ABC transporter permease [Herminiimonas arsenitoxidans]|uniref:ABC transporter permease n=1 Tax=Herminiimonas arsenitoxidans TaxID=1809410 RepID=UPI0009705EA9|nr:ABC transporter permease [Herminiimonas arsenitoxidans]